MRIRCQKCGDHKESYEFYKNSKKLNGLESHCKSCVLERKAKKYEAIAKSKKKTKQLRLHKKVKVMDIEECTFNELLISRPVQSENDELLKEFVDGVLCYQDMKKFKESVTAG